MFAKSFHQLCHLVKSISLASGFFVLCTAQALNAQGPGMRAYGLPFILDFIRNKYFNSLS